MNSLLSSIRLTRRPPHARANNPSNTGHVNWDLDVMYEVCPAAVRDGWRIGTHAAGDRAVRLVLDVYERVMTTGELTSATLVIEHTLLADPEQQARAVRFGIGITVQHSLLWNMGSEMLTTWARNEPPGSTTPVPLSR